MIRGEGKDLKRLRRICGAIAGVVETSSWGHANWRAGKAIFASFEETRTGNVVSAFVGPEKQEELLEDPRFSPPRYTDHHGWICLKIDRDTDWNLVRDLVLFGHRLVSKPEAKPSEEDKA